MARLRHPQTGRPSEHERIKAGERAAQHSGGLPSALDGVAHALPALLCAEELGKRAARCGFDWPDEQGPLGKIEEELAELAEARAGEAQARVEEELGDLLFAVANLARHLDVAPEEALAAANRKFERRFRRLEQDIREDGRAVIDLDIDALEGYWQRAKPEV